MKSGADYLIYLGFVMIRILIFGHSGFIGTNFCKYCEDFSGIKLIHGSKDDIACPSSAKEKYKRVDVVINLAASVGVGASILQPANFISDNVRIASSVCEISYSLGASLIHVSSFVYGPPKYNPIDENHPTSPVNPYMLSKLCSEDVILRYARLFPLRYLILRPFNLYGYFQRSDFIIPALIKSMRTKSLVEINSLASKRDYLFISDFCSALRLVSLRINDSRGLSNIYNLGSGVSLSIGELMSMLTAFGGNVNYVCKNIDDAVSDCVADISLFSSDFNWAPRVDIHDGLELLYNFEH